jgi:hypothetical protein
MWWKASLQPGNDIIMASHAILPVGDGTGGEMQECHCE